MASSRNELPSRQESEIISRSRSERNAESMARSAGVPQRLRNDGTNANVLSIIANQKTNPSCSESWVEIASQPSSSSLSSIGDEIVTTGLRVQHDPSLRRRRRGQPNLPSHISLEARQTSTSSQEEYEEIESESDQVMTSSNEHIVPATRRSTTSNPEYRAGSGSESDDDDENA